MGMWLINIYAAIFIGFVCFLFGFIRGIEWETDWSGWSNGWQCCLDAIKKGLSEEGKELVDLYTGKDEENADC